jgi:signal transduction histidine kinase
MKSLYLRVWLTLVATLALFAVVAGLLFSREVQRERRSVDAANVERLGAWADLIENSLPPASAPADEQSAAVREWSRRLRLPLALDDASGARIVASESFVRRQESPTEGRGGRWGASPQAVKLDDGRTLWVARPARASPPAGADGARPPGERLLRDGLGLPPGLGLIVLLALLFVGVALGAYPVVRRLTRRLEALERGVRQFGAGRLDHRVDDGGGDEVAAVARAFNESAQRVELLVQGHRSLLANASHELRSPLARLKMALGMLDEAPTPEQRDRLAREIRTDIGELDALVDEVLLASRLEAQPGVDRREAVALEALVLEESARVRASTDIAEDLGPVEGDERLLRRAVRNLLENARRYGGGVVDVTVVAEPGMVTTRVADRGPGVPEAMRERIFEPFFRLPGHAEREGGVGLGLSLVRQIARAHGGSVRCEARPGGGSVFVLSLPKKRD